MGYTVANVEYIEKTTFERWRKRVVAGYIVLAIASAIGIKAETDKSSDDLARSLNSQRLTSCHIGQTNARKFNDFVNGAVVSRTNEAAYDVAHGNPAAAKLNYLDAARYKKDLEHVRTEAECQALLVK